MDSVRGYMEQGYRYIRVQMGGYGGKATNMVKPEGALDGAYFDRREYARVRECRGADRNRG